MNEFLRRMEKALRGIGADEREEILADFREHFAIGLAAGKTAQQVAQQLGDPEQLARMYAAMGATKKARTSKRPGDAMRMIGAMVTYKLGGGILMGSLYFGCVCALVVLLAAAAAISAGGLGCIGLAVVEWVLGFLGYGFAALFTGIILGAAGILGWLGTVWLWKKSFGYLPTVAHRMMRSGQEEAWQ